jgi:2-C-methyl-D-erythritol 4-phosphate cytidylyltransferase
VIGLVLVAAGSGRRLGAQVPKALVEVAGDTLIGHCLRAVSEVGEISDRVVVAPAPDVATVAADVGTRLGARVVAGGTTRDASVRAGLAALDPAVTHVLIHDAARPFTPTQVYRRVLAELAAGAVAVVPALPVTDTVKRVRDGVVVKTLDRDELVGVQTPQGFRLAELRAAHARQRGEVTDDAMLMEQAGIAVRVVTGSDHAFKITTPFDLAVARAMQED